MGQKISGLLVIHNFLKYASHEKSDLMGKIVMLESQLTPWVKVFEVLQH